MYLVALVVVLMATAVAAQTTKPDMLHSSVKEAAERTPLKPGVVVKDYFKDFRPGTCKVTTTPSAPNGTWQARGDNGDAERRKRVPGGARNNTRVVARSNDFHGVHA